MKKLSQRDEDLTRRYLIWCYKTTKEELDRIDRYFTQGSVDDFVLKNLKSSKDYKSSKSNPEYKKHVDDFKVYMDKKQSAVRKKKYVDAKCTKLDPNYQYLTQRFKALEKAIVHFLGKKELEVICDLYEDEFTERILEARDSD